MICKSSQSNWSSLAADFNPYDTKDLLEVVDSTPPPLHTNTAQRASREPSSKAMEVTWEQQTKPYINDLQQRIFGSKKCTKDKTECYWYSAETFLINPKMI